MKYNDFFNIVSNAFNSVNIEKFKIISIKKFFEYSFEYREKVKEYQEKNNVEFMKFSLEERFNFNGILEDSKSIIVALIPYEHRNIVKQDVDDRIYGYVTNSAWEYDYHKVVGGKLTEIVNKLTSEFSDELFKVLVDTSPLIDRLIARAANLGEYGKNTFLINKDYGTSFYIGYIISTVDIKDEPNIDYIDVDICENCSKCVDLCPTNALKGNFTMDVEKCISYISQKKNFLTEYEMDKMGSTIYGCDICQMVCPHNFIKKEVPFEYKRKTKNLIDVKEILKLSNKKLRDRYKDSSFMWRGSNIIKRNAIIVLRNKGSKEDISFLKEVYNHVNDDNKKYINLAIAKLKNEEDTMSNIHELEFLKDNIEDLKKQGVHRELPVLEGANEAEIILNGKKVINLSSNNYLGLANHPRLKKAAIEAVEKYGVGAGAVRTIVGNMDIHEKLEEKLAEFKREEAVMVYQSGFNCNAGTIQAITEKGDLIVSDSLNHASIIDGVRLSKADRAVFEHSDMKDLERVLKEKRKDYNRCLIITDGVFSMDGDIAKLPEIVELAEKYDCMTYVDDAHGSGVLGESGRGTVDHFGLHGRVDFTIGTLSKAIGVIGGYVAGKAVTKDWLSHRGRPILFSTALPPAAVGAIIESINMLMESTEYTDKLWDNAKFFKEKLGKLGFDTGKSETPITPVIIGEEAKAMEFSRNF